MDLIERAPLLAQLAALLADARRGSGSLVLLSGEAGVGKTSVARAFVTRDAESARVLWGTCDPLVTPEPLGPFRDMVPLAPVIAKQRGRAELLGKLLEELQAPRSTVMVVDDAHWADDATLDAVRFLGRRVHATTGMLLVTYREDEVLAGSPLRAVLGDLATAPASRRLRVPPFTAEAVAQLAAGHAVDAEKLYATTGGNPFYVTEVLAATGWTVPGTVRDAVLARVSRLDSAARDVLEAVSLSPGGLEPEIAIEVSGQAAIALDRCVEQGMLVMESNRIAFRHELARLAVEGSFPATRRRRMHHRLLEHLEQFRDLDPARLAHHADAAGNAAAVLRYAVLAGREASQRGAHRAAAEQFGRAVAAAGPIAAVNLADLLSEWADERQVFDDLRDVLAIRQRAVDLRRQAGDRLGEGRELLALARVTSRLGNAATSVRHSRDALDILNTLPPGPELALAHAVAAFDEGEEYKVDRAIRRATEILALAETVGATTATIIALRIRAEAEMFAGRAKDGLASYAEARRLALREGDHEGALACALGAAGGLLMMRRYAEATSRLQEAIEFGRAIDLDYVVGAAQASIGWIHFEQGRWDEAERVVVRLLREQGRYPLALLAALEIRGRIQVRRGLPAAKATLEEAREIAAGSDFWQQWSIAAGRAEFAWLADRTAEIPDLVRHHYEVAHRAGIRWPAGELGFWLWRGGAMPEPPPDVAEPFALQMAGEWGRAAAAWEQLGCPYEQAEALADGDEPSMRQALAIFSRLGAEPAAARLRHRMRREGLSHVPARPRRSRSGAPAQLTRRELEILELVERGLTNGEIAKRLFITEKTAGHHVSAILAKLGARSRTEAASTARKMGIIVPTM